MSETLYKVLNADGSAFHGGKGNWFLPNGKPGEWMPKIGNIEPCVCGYHILKPEMLLGWLGPAIFEVEVRGDVIWQSDKGVASEARLVRRLDTWNEQTARLFACDCAESVVHLANDKRSVEAIRVSRRYAFGLASASELDAACDAARGAPRGAAWDAAKDAARGAAKDAAWDAARAAAWAAGDAAWYAAWYAAWDAHTKRLFEYLNGQVDLEEIRRKVA